LTRTPRCTQARRRPRWLVLLPCLAACHCAGGRHYDLARQAEKRGQPQEAYDHYCKAAAARPGSGGVADGLARVRPGAAAYWESQALAEMDAGRYADAWRLLMRCLSIQPDHSTAPKLIRQLEAQHPDVIAQARDEYLRRGTIALAVGPPARPVPEQLAMATPRPGAAAIAAPPEPARSFDPIPFDPPTSAEPAKSPEPPPPAEAGAAEAKDKPVEAPPAPPEPADIAPPVVAVEPAAPAVEPESPAAPAASAETVAPPEPPPATPEPAGIRRLPDVHITVQPEAEPPPRPARPAFSASRGEFMIITTLSRRDRLYARSARLVDGVEVRLKDTEADLEANFDLYCGKKRIKKIRDLTIGRSQIFEGVSGRLFRLTLLGIHHKSRTVRIGVKPA
jgi:hypothetical protein